MTDTAPGFGRRSAAPTYKAAPPPAEVRPAKAEKVRTPREPLPLGTPGLPGTVFIVVVFALVALLFQQLLWFTVLNNTFEQPAWAMQTPDAWNGVDVPADPRRRGWVPPWLILGIAGLVGAGVGTVLARSRYKRAISYLRALVFSLAGYMSAWMVSSTVGMVAAMWWSPTGRDPVKLVLSALMGPFGGLLGGLVGGIAGILVTGPMLGLGALLIWSVTQSLDRSGKRAP